MVTRILNNSIQSHLTFEKAIIVKGARQVGKTTLIKEIIKNKSNVLWLDGDDPDVRQIWSNISKSRIELFISDYDYIVIDEAQRIENIGLTAKMIIDLKLNKQVVLSGSSSINLSSSIHESLTGRKWTFELFPFSWEEIVNQNSLYKATLQLDQLLIFGSYPEIYTSQEKRKNRLIELTNSYLLKDVFLLSDIKKPKILPDLLKALALQVGSEVSYNELANMLKVSNETIKSYIDILEENYVLFRLEPFSSNPRKEISKSRKIYFYDNGIMNTLINNFDPIDSRQDKGGLWENYIISEMKKKLSYHEPTKKLKFWRSKSGPEIDLIIEDGKEIEAIEIKYNPKVKVKFNALFLEKYKPTKTTVINKDNFYEHL